MNHKRLTGEEIIYQIGINMHQGMEPLLTKVLAPSLYQVYLHRDDYDRLRNIFDELESQAQEHLKRELARLNGEGGRNRGFFKASRDRGEGRKRYVAATGNFHIQFQADPSGSVGRGEVQVVTELAVGEAPRQGTRAKTHRILKNTGGLATGVKGKAGAKTLAWVYYEDDRGPQTYAMTSREIVVGRGADDVRVDLKLDTQLDVSRKHARIRYDPNSGNFWIKDLSQFGTAVNGRDIPSSLGTKDNEERDLDRWTPLPHRAIVELAGVMTLEFKKAEE